MIKLIVYPKTANSRWINPSPFCSKAEIFLELTKLDFEVKEFKGNPSKFPNKKLPVINDQGQIVCDSTVIMQYMGEKYNIDFDKHLSDK